MNREEIVNNIGYQMTKAAMEYYQANCTKDVDLSDAFEEGAEWMQETMIFRIKNLLRDLEITVNAESRFGVHTVTTKLEEALVEQICDILSR